MADDPDYLGRIVNETRRSFAGAYERPSEVAAWEKRHPRQQDLDREIAAAVEKEVRDRIITLLQDHADREQAASDAFPGDPGFIGAARAAGVAALIAKGETGGEGMMP